MTEKSPLLVLVTGTSTPKGPRREFRSAIESFGGAWQTLRPTVGAILDQVSAVAPGTHVLFLGEHDTPLSDSLSAIAEACAERPLVDVIYADKLLANSRRQGESARLRFPDWSPWRGAFEPYVGDTFVVKTTTLLAVGSSFDPNAKWDNWAFLRACVRCNVSAAHIDTVWCETESMSRSRGARASTAPLVTIPAAVPAIRPDQCTLITLTAGVPRAHDDDTPIVTDHLSAIRSSDAATAHHVVVVGEECAPGVRDSLNKDKKLTVVSDSTSFNFARRSNLGREAARGDVLVFVNDDFVPSRADWLQRLLAPLGDPAVGVTGGTLLFEDDTVQHLGVGVIQGSDCHFYRGSAVTDRRVASLLAMDREVDAVTGACLAIRTELFDEVGGFFEGFPLNYNDIDLCLKVRALGHSIVHVGSPLGHHLESKSRQPAILPEEASLFYSRWPTRPLHSLYPFELHG